MDNFTKMKIDLKSVTLYNFLKTVKEEYSLQSKRMPKQYLERLLPMSLSNTIQSYFSLSGTPLFPEQIPVHERFLELVTLKLDHMLRWRT